MKNKLTIKESNFIKFHMNATRLWVSKKRDKGWGYTFRENYLTIFRLKNCFVMGYIIYKMDQQTAIDYILKRLDSYKKILPDVYVFEELPSSVMLGIDNSEFAAAAYPGKWFWRKLT